MSQKSIILVIVLFAIIIAGMFMYAFLKKSELETVNNVPSEVMIEDSVVPYANITRVDAKHYIKDNKHTLVGEIIFPTPCDLLEAEATVMESFPEQVTIDFSVINNTDICTQMITAQRFKVDLTASIDATFQARFMGRDIELNLIPAAADESPDDFEIFIKG
jgi:hypothetical protein